MAHRLMLPGKPEGLPFIWNVDAHVGHLASCANRPTDVELIKYLRTMLDSFGKPSRPRHASVANVRLELNGQFDAVLAYRIFSSQAGMQYPGKVVDGIISPIRGHGSPYIWTLGQWNYHFHKAQPVLFQNLPDAPGLSAALRAELKRTV
ncbi:hypothetical protein [Ideonella sp. A 288]|uniref:hypothetical protein n=1 Tax=Ideonella sp. A 288 TaxID=1962181 RepID=UPI001184DF88|nr:hypothetical protein [Ideonella sp. A 288]